MFRIFSRFFHSIEYSSNVWKPKFSEQESRLHRNLIKQRKHLFPPVPSFQQINQQKIDFNSLSETTQNALNQLKSQEKHGLYCKLEINTKPFLVTKNDVIIMKRLPKTKVGDLLLLPHIKEVGTKDFYLKGEQVSQICEVKAMVLEQTKSAKYTKFLRRRGRGPGDRKWRKRSHRDLLTTLRISDISLSF